MRWHVKPMDEMNKRLNEMVSEAISGPMEIIKKETRSAIKKHETCMNGSKDAESKISCMSSLIVNLQKVDEVKTEMVLGAAVQGTIMAAMREALASSDDPGELYI